MAKLLYSATMSLDAYIAGPGGDMSWLTPYLGPNPEGAFGGAYQGPVVVLTHQERPPTSDTTYTADVDEAVRLAREAAGEKAYVNVLGADIARQLLARGLIDEILVIVAPVLLGGGVPLLADEGSGGYRLERIHESAAPLGVNLWFRVVRDCRRAYTAIACGLSSPGSRSML